MEDKIRKQKIKAFIMGAVAYLLGTILYDALGYKKSYSREIFGFIFLVIGRSLYDLYQYKKYPKLKEKEKQLEKDERLVFIRDRAAYITNNIVFAALIIIWFASIVKGNGELSDYVSCFIAFIFVVMELVKYYLSKRI